MVEKRQPDLDRQSLFLVLSPDGPSDQLDFGYWPHGVALTLRQGVEMLRKEFAISDKTGESMDYKGRTFRGSRCKAVWTLDDYFILVEVDIGKNLRKPQTALL